MKSYVGITDSDWFSFLRKKDSLDEVNFWQPGGTRIFKTLNPGELFLFKLHSPHNFIVGGGIFAHSTLLPTSLAWAAFGESNGARSLEEMRARTMRYRRRIEDPREDFTVGCIILSQPFFFPEEQWIPIPEDWSPNIVQGKTYDFTTETGAALLTHIQSMLGATLLRDIEQPRYGQPILVQPRLGQGSFRVLVTDAYERRCSVTGERVLPVLEAAHVRPFASGGEHKIDNGLLLRSDLHTLFDRGYLTVTQDFHLEVSRRIRDEFENGRDYYALQGALVRDPRTEFQKVANSNILWHNEKVFLG